MSTEILSFFFFADTGGAWRPGPTEKEAFLENKGTVIMSEG